MTLKRRKLRKTMIEAMNLILKIEIPVMTRKRPYHQYRQD